MLCLYLQLRSTKIDSLYPDCIMYFFCQYPTSGDTRPLKHHLTMKGGGITVFVDPGSELSLICKKVMKKKN